MASNSANLWVLLGLGLAGILLMTKKLKRVVKEDFGAFIERLQLLPPPHPLPPKAPNPLAGLNFVVPDLFDIDGYVTGFGNPDWARTHDAASKTASIVSTVVEGGATCIGRTVIDEMAFSVTGENKHYGAPINPAAPDRVPGGSCSGSAVAVAANLVDFSLGMDSVGGVRLPAGFCNIIGFRSSQGVLSTAGIIPVSTSLDAVGCFARDLSVLYRVSNVMIGLQFAAPRNPRQIILADDCFELLKMPVDRVMQPVIKSTGEIFGRQVLKHEKLGVYLSTKVPSLLAFSSEKMNGEAKTSTLSLLAHVMQVLLRHEFKVNHEQWMSSTKPDIDANIRAQLLEGDTIDANVIQKLHTVRNEMRFALNLLLKDDAMLVIPTFAEPPAKLGKKEMHSEAYLNRLFSLLSIASLSGCCQVTVPLGHHNKCPVSVSFIAKHGGDRFLLDTLRSMYASLLKQGEEASISSMSKSSTSTFSRENSAEMAKEKGNQAFKEKQWQKAISLYTEAIKLDESNATYYSNRAAAHLELGSFVQAEGDCTKAINLDKKNVKALLRRGTAREMLGYYKDASEDFRYALVLEPTNKRASISLDRLKSLFQ